MPSVEEFLKFLNERCCIFEMLEINKVKQEATQPASASKKTDRRVTLIVTSQTCPVCKSNHYIYNCTVFLKVYSKLACGGKKNAVMY